MRRLGLVLAACAVVAAACVAESDVARPSGRPRLRQDPFAGEVGDLLGASAGRPEATASTPPPTVADGNADVVDIGNFMTFVLREVEGYWAPMFRAAGQPGPEAGYLWLEPGERVRMSCVGPGGAPQVTTDDTAAYCPPDDTIFVAKQMAVDLWQGLANVGGEVRQSTLPGDFAVAYVVAHEYAHNVQNEIGVFGFGLPTWQTELQADCMAGLWANSAYFEGVLDDQDIEEGLATADLFGDFAFDSPGHHGTPRERVEAFGTGYATGDPDACGEYLQG